MTVYCSTCDVTITLPPGEFITICEGCSAVVYSNTTIVHQTRPITTDDIRGQREKCVKRLRHLEEREADLIENGGNHPEMERQLTNVSAAKWQVEQGLRVLDMMEGKLEKAVDKRTKEMRVEENVKDDKDDDQLEDEEEDEEQMEKSDHSDDEEDEVDTGVDEKDSFEEEDSSDNDDEEASFELIKEKQAEKEKTVESNKAENPRPNLFLPGNMTSGMIAHELEPSMGLMASMPFTLPPSAFNLSPSPSPMMPFSCPSFCYGPGMFQSQVDQIRMMANHSYKSIIVSPQSQMIFNGPFDKVQSTQIKLRNPAGYRIEWNMTYQACNQNNRIEFTPTSGALEAGMETTVTVRCTPFRNESITSADLLTVEWVFVPAIEGWPWSSPHIHHSSLSIIYKP